MFILLIGPKGSGKTHIGGVLSQRLGVHFFHVEPHWLAYHRACVDAGRALGIAEGIARIHPLIGQVLQQYEHVCVETTGASQEILDDLLAVGAGHAMLLVRVRAPLELCLRRIAQRDSAQQIPADEARIRFVHELSERRELQYDVQLDNETLDDEDIVRRISPHLIGTPPFNDRAEEA